MIFAAILAGGTGSRMGNQEKPKQYLPLGKKPIIVYTVEKFLCMSEFEKVVILCPKAWIETTKDILKTYIGDAKKIAVIPGGKSRNETIMQAVSYLEDNYQIDDSSILVTHDSVRPFVTYRIIKDNIDAMTLYDACDTVIPATDTIVESFDNEKIDSIPNRNHLYQGQTPQTFKIIQLKALYEKLSNEEKESLTDACKIFILNHYPVCLVQGESFNIKITYPSDLKMARSLLGEFEDA